MDMAPEASVPANIPEELLRNCHDNIVEAFRSVSRSLPGARSEEEPGVVRIATPTRGNVFNVVYVTHPPSDANALIERSASFMAEAGVSRWRVEAFPGAESVVGEAALAAGMVPRPTMPGMVLFPTPARRPGTPTGLRIRQATTKRLWETMVKTAARGFGGQPPDDTETLYPFALSRVLRGYVGLVGKKPVATSFTLSYHGVGGVYFVATLPEERGKGYGTALTWSAVAGARRDGCRASFLQATEMGAPVYARMGYRPVCSYAGWETKTT
jgi:GNAT superfamily N-acetyltransferase